MLKGNTSCITTSTSSASLATNRWTSKYKPSLLSRIHTRAINLGQRSNDQCHRRHFKVQQVISSSHLFLTQPPLPGQTSWLPRQEKSYSRTRRSRLRKESPLGILREIAVRHSSTYRKDISERQTSSSQKQLTLKGSLGGSRHGQIWMQMRRGKQPLCSRWRRCDRVILT